MTEGRQAGGEQRVRAVVVFQGGGSRSTSSGGRSPGPGGQTLLEEGRRGMDHRGRSGPPNRSPVCLRSLPCGRHQGRQAQRAGEAARGRCSSVGGHQRVAAWRGERQRRPLRQYQAVPQGPAYPLPMGSGLLTSARPTVPTILSTCPRRSCGCKTAGNSGRVVAGAIAALPS